MRVKVCKKGGLSNGQRQLLRDDERLRAQIPGGLSHLESLLHIGFRTPSPHHLLVTPTFPLSLSLSPHSLPPLTWMLQSTRRRMQGILFSAALSSKKECNATSS